MRRAAWPWLFLSSLLVVMVTSGRSAADLTPQAEAARFYQGKTLRLIVASGPGAAFDMWSRLIARHMGKHIPGSPSIIVQNMPGGGQVIGANYLYSVAKPEGITFVTITGTLYLLQMTGAPGVQFNWSDFTFIGRTQGVTTVFFIRADIPYKDWRELRAAKEPIHVGSTGSGTRHIVPAIMKEILGFNLNIISGYPSAALADAAVERRELAGGAFAMPQYIAREPAKTWHEKGFVRTILQTGKERDPLLDRGVPSIWEIAKELRIPDADVELMETLMNSFDLLVTFVAPPGVPADRAKILREAFHRTLREPAFVREAEKVIGVAPNSMDPEEMHRLAVRVTKVRPEIAARVKELLGH
jgi:tripartite-type tricarboxylate transporter receptor subunit TctC